MAKGANVTLEDFIKKYNDSKNKKRKTYSQYLTEQGDMTEARYAEAVNEAQKEYDRAKAGYGRSGEALSKRGLNGSGYAAFLDSNAYSELQNSKREAEKARNTAERKNRSAYAEYLENTDKAENRLFTDTVDDIYRYGSNDYDSSYKLAISAGLDKEMAKHAAEIGMALAKEEEKSEEPKKAVISTSTRRVLLSEILSKRYYGERAYAFLIACGLEEEDAKTIVDAADKIRGSKASDSSSSTSFFK